ncbi:ROK family protein [Candidatus Saccharibacteria bacterium]|jgi:glucokinase|nr:ROK family protein [Candidatus Saccharibacteria bacterium]
MYLCIDVGGTKTLVALFNAKGKLLHSVKFPTNVNQAKFYQALIQQIKVNFVLSDIKAISVAMPGIVKQNCAVWLGNLPWHDFDIAKKLNKDFGLPVHVENDANLAALAEARNAKGRSLYFTFSTGIGGGVIDNGTLAKHYTDFEPGHIEYVYEGKKAEWEDFAAASAINEKFGKYVSDLTTSAEWNEVVRRMLLGLVPLTTSIKPDRIIFGGPLGLHLNSYRAKLRKEFTASLPAGTTLPRLLVAKYGSFSSVYGCYYYARLKESRR